MPNKIPLYALLVCCFSLWLQNFALTTIIKRVERQNQDLRKRLITLEDYTFGTHTEDDIWEDYYGK